MTSQLPNNFYYVYVLFSISDRKLYIGYTQNLESRYLAHNYGKVRATKNRLPVILIHYETFRVKHDALSREKYLKSGYGRNELKKSLHVDLVRLNYKYLPK